MYKYDGFCNLAEFMCSVISHRSMGLTIAGIETLSLYGQHFFEQLSKLELECDQTRKQSLMTGTPVQDCD